MQPAAQLQVVASPVQHWRRALRARWRSLDVHEPSSTRQIAEGSASIRVTGRRIILSTATRRMGSEGTKMTRQEGAGWVLVITSSLLATFLHGLGWSLISFGVTVAGTVLIALERRKQKA